MYLTFLAILTHSLTNSLTASANEHASNEPNWNHVWANYSQEEQQEFDNAWNCFIHTFHDPQCQKQRNDKEERIQKEKKQYERLERERQQREEYLRQERERRQHERQERERQRQKEYQRQEQYENEIIDHISQAYQVLNLTASATSTEIKKAYKRLALEKHPDRNPSDPNATVNFQKIGDAYNTIQAEYEKKGRQF